MNQYESAEQTREAARSAQVNLRSFSTWDWHDHLCLHPPPLLSTTASKLNFLHIWRSVRPRVLIARSLAPCPSRLGTRGRPPLHLLGSYRCAPSLRRSSGRRRRSLARPTLLLMASAERTGLSARERTGEQPARRGEQESAAELQHVFWREVSGNHQISCK